MMSLATLGTGERIDLLNIFLILLSGALALLIPFPLFLFAYAVLGPLHYLSEISWLHDRSYFVRDKKGLGIFLVTSVAAVLLALSGVMPAWFPPLTVYLLFGGALILVLTEEKRKRNIFLALLFITAFLFAFFEPPLYVLLFAILIPTVIHVFVFTALFMLAGVLKSKSIFGLISFLALIVTATSLFFFVPQKEGVSPGTYIFESYQPFLAVNEGLMQLFLADIAEPSIEAIFTSRTGQAIMQFIAFAYTYHYLNWFSKTKVIGWNEISSSRRRLIVSGWLLAVLLYAYDYRIGIQALLFLSLLHVFFEFPLNHRSLVDIGKGLHRLLSPPASL